VFVYLGEAHGQYQWKWAMANSYRTSCDWKTGRFKCTKESCKHSFDGRKECTISEVPTSGGSIGNVGYMPSPGIGGLNYENHGSASWGSSSNYRVDRPWIRGHSYKTQCRTHNGIKTCTYLRCTSFNGRQECSSSDGSTNTDQFHIENNELSPNLGNGGTTGRPSEKSEISHYDFPGRFN